MIPEYIIEQVKEANDIVDVISSHISLVRKGQNYWAPCPFHDEKTASFSVSPSKQIYHCFGCNAGGSVINFVMEYTKVNFVESVKELAENAGIEIPDDHVSKEDKSEIQTLYDLHDWVMQQFEKKLYTPEGKTALDYLHNRGLNDNFIKTHHLGWAPAGWDFLIKGVKKEKKALDLLETGGLISSKDKGGHYDRFRERIIFPIRNPKGHCVGFGGRILGDSKEAKYLNSPESPIYHKGKILYGLHESIKEIRQKKRVLVVEGYMDWLQLTQAGFNNCVAGSGTAFTTEHGRLLKRYSNDAILCYDSDTAGQNAALKTGLMLSGQKLNIHILQLPAGEDPDSFLKQHGASTFKKSLDESLNYFDFLDHYISEYAAEPSARSELLQRIIDALKAFPDPVFREIFARDVAGVFKVSSDIFLNSIRELKGRSKDLKRPIADPNRFTLVKNKSEASQFQLIQLMLLDDETIRRTTLEYISPDIFPHKGYRQAATVLLEILQKNPLIPSKNIPDAIENPKIRGFIVKLIFDLESQVENGQKAFLDCMREMENELIHKQIRDIEEKQREADISGHFDPQLMQESLKLTERLRNLPFIYTMELFDN